MHSFVIITEELSADTPEVVPVRTRRQGSIRPPARRSFDKLFSHFVLILPISLHLLHIQ